MCPSLAEQFAPSDVVGCGIWPQLFTLKFVPGSGSLQPSGHHEVMGAPQMPGAIKQRRLGSNGGPYRSPPSTGLGDHMEALRVLSVFSFQFCPGLNERQIGATSGARFHALL